MEREGEAVFCGGDFLMWGHEREERSRKRFSIGRGNGVMGKNGRKLCIYRRGERDVTKVRTSIGLTRGHGPTQRKIQGFYFILCLKSFFSP